MASAFTHGFAAIAGGTILPERLRTAKLYFLGMFCAIVPDADVIAFSLNIPYAHPMGHRGFTHSIIFAILLGLVIRMVFYRKESAFGKEGIFLSCYFVLSTLSHAFLDAMTTGGKGIGFFIPFENARYFFPFRPIKVSPIGVSNFFSEWGLKVILSEIQWVGIPLGIFMLMVFIIRKMRKNPA